MGNSTSKTSDPIIRMKQGTSSSSHKSRMCEEDCQLCAITNDTDEIYDKSSATKIPNPKPKVETPIIMIEKPNNDSERLAKEKRTREEQERLIKEKQLKEEQERLMREKPSRDEMTSGGCAGLTSMMSTSVLDKTGKFDLTHSKAKVVGLFFAAIWCTPARYFTPLLAEFYKKFGQAKNFEVIFVSADQNEEKFKTYYNEMPWLALPFEQRAAKTSLCEKYNVTGVPLLVLLDAATGEIINHDARKSLMSDPAGVKFPWKGEKTFGDITTVVDPKKRSIDPKKNKSLIQLLDKNVINYQNEKIDLKTKLPGRVLGLYFSAYWNPTCRQFTPILNEFFKKYRKERKLRFKIIYISSDNTVEQFKKYYRDMHWWALAYEQKQLRIDISKMYNVTGLPTLVLIDVDTGNVINYSARAAVMADPTGTKYPWKQDAQISTPKTIMEKTNHIGFKNEVKGTDVGIMPLLVNNVINGKKEKKDVKNKFVGKTLAFYFSSLTRKECAAFTPKLIQFYNKHKDVKNLDIILVSSDENEAEFNEQFSKMPWLALVFEQRQLKADIWQKFGVTQMPTVGLLDADTGVIIHKNIASQINSDPDLTLFSLKK